MANTIVHLKQAYRKKVMNPSICTNNDLVSMDIFNISVPHPPSVAMVFAFTSMHCWPNIVDLKMWYQFHVMFMFVGKWVFGRPGTNVFNFGCIIDNINMSVHFF